MLQGKQCVGSEETGRVQLLEAARAVEPDGPVDRAIAKRDVGNQATNRAARGGRRRGVAVVPLLFLVAGLIAGCRDNEDASLCAVDKDCGVGGCLVAPVSRLSYCADAAPGCPTHQRWASTAGDELAGQCIAMESTIDAGVIHDGSVAASSVKSSTEIGRAP